MLLYYGGIEIHIASNTVAKLQQFAVVVLKLMQKADREWAENWTACTIDFSGISPEFSYSSIGGMDKDAAVWVTVDLHGKVSFSGIK